MQAGVDTLICHLLLYLYIGFTRAEIVAPAWVNPNKNPCSEISWQYLTWTDGKCYKIFSQGPCDDTYELAYNDFMDQAICRCPKKYYVWPQDGRCYKQYSKGPCETGNYFTVESGLGKCEKEKKCSSQYLFWAPTQECYREFTRGPCYKGDILYQTKGEIKCGCNQEELRKYYWEPALACYQHYQVGPCEAGHIFVYNNTLRTTECTCDPSFIANYHEPTNKCYQLNTEGPCGRGHVILYNPTTRKPECRCKENHVTWSTTNQCYREFTRGPCGDNQFIISRGQFSRCIDNPCKPGYLYFPNTNGCYRTGVSGPCKEGEIVTYDPDLSSSYRGICGCSYDLRHNFWHKDGKCYIQNTQGPCLKNQVFLYNKLTNKNQCVCDVRQGYVSIGNPDICYKLKTEGPCSQNEILVFNSGTMTFECECKEGYFLERITNMCFPHHQQRSLDHKGRKTIWTL